MEELIKESKLMFEAFGYDISKINADINNFRLIIENKKLSREKNIIDYNLSPLLFMALNLVSKLIGGSLTDPHSIYNFLNLDIEPFDGSLLFIQIDHISIKMGSIYFEAHCYNSESLLIAKASSILLLPN